MLVKLPQAYAKLLQELDVVFDQKTQHPMLSIHMLSVLLVYEHHKLHLHVASAAAQGAQCTMEHIHWHAQKL